MVGDWKMAVHDERKTGVVRSYRDLDVWQKSIDLTKDLYSATRGFPEDERFGLVHQIRRAGVSLCSNIAEGQARRTSKDFIQFLHIAKGSVAELDTQLILAQGLGYLEAAVYQKLLEQIVRVQKMLTALIIKVSDSKAARS